MYSLVFSELRSCSRELSDCSDMREVHRTMCKVVNSLFKRVFYVGYFVNPSNKKKFWVCLTKLAVLMLACDELQIKELKRYWKVKRVQIAKLFVDFRESARRNDLLESVDRVFINGLLYSSSRWNGIFLFTLAVKSMYALLTEDRVTS